MTLSKHLKILGRSNPVQLNNPEFIKYLMIQLIRKADMEILGFPMVYVVPLSEEKLNSSEFKDSGGVTTQLIGYSTLTTSHTAIHTFPKKNEFHLDFYSCKAFNKREVLNVIEKMLQPTKLQVVDLTEYCDWSPE